MTRRNTIIIDALAVIAVCYLLTRGADLIMRWVK